MKNAVLTLRQQQLDAAKRPYKARGSKLNRCQTCLLSISLCICEQKEPADCGSAVCLLMYHNESFKPSNTGRLIADIVPDNYAFRWDRVVPDPALLRLLTDPSYAPIIVFPAENVSKERIIERVNHVADKKPLYIFLDGTWREAKKMFNKSPYLDQLPVLSVTPSQLSEYRLRSAAHPHQLGTAEVACLIFEQNNELDAAKKLTEHFMRLRNHYLKGKRSTLTKFEQDVDC